MSIFAGFVEFVEGLGIVVGKVGLLGCPMRLNCCFRK